MKLKIVRRGGLAGVEATAERDVSDLTVAQRAALDTLVHSTISARSAPGADRFQFRLTLSDDGVTRELEIPEDQMPDELASMVRAPLR